MSKTRTKTITIAKQLDRMEAKIDTTWKGKVSRSMTADDVAKLNGDADKAIAAITLLRDYFGVTQAARKPE